MASFFREQNPERAREGAHNWHRFSQYRRRGLREKREISILLIEFSRCTCHFLRRTDGRWPRFLDVLDVSL